MVAAFTPPAPNLPSRHGDSPKRRFFSRCASRTHTSTPPRHRHAARRASAACPSRIAFRGPAATDPHPWSCTRLPLCCSAHSSRLTMRTSQETVTSRVRLRPAMAGADSVIPRCLRALPVRLHCLCSHQQRWASALHCCDLLRVGMLACGVTRCRSPYSHECRHSLSTFSLTDLSAFRARRYVQHICPTYHGCS